MSTMGGGGCVLFLEAQEENPAASTTAARRVRVAFMFVDRLFGFVMARAVARPAAHS